MEQYSFADFQSGKKPPKGWDAADAVADGWGKAELDAYMRATVMTVEDWREWRETEWPAAPDTEPEFITPMASQREPTSQPPYRLSCDDTLPIVSDTPALAFKRRPVIKHVDCELPTVVNMACAAAVRAGAHLYGRGTSLTRPVTIQTAAALRGVMHAEGTTVLVTVDKPALVEILTSLIDWRRYDGRKGDDKPVACPASVAETIIARRGDWPFPQLNAVISAPTMRPDYSILNVPGFDSETGILFASSVVWPRMPEHPNLDDAKSALSLLTDLVRSFPFVSASDRSAALAMILTAIVRPCMPSAPLFGVSAPTPGTGKSKLVDIAAILATGRAASVLSVPREEEELRKHVGSVLMSGDAFVTLDNIEFPLRSEFLCQVLTQGSVDVRVLGESRTLKLPTSATFCATGNSLRFAGDLTRRVVLINLDAGMERPESRVFETDVIDMARARRTELVTAALTILRAFVVQRGPNIVPALGGFEGWSNLVRSALMWVGEADPLSNTEKVRENDPERERTAAIFASLPAERAWTVSEICRMIEQDRGRGIDFRHHEGLSDALGEFIGQSGQLNAVRFGHFLRKQAGRIIDGRKITNRGLDRNKVALWAIEDVSRPQLGEF